MFKQVIKFIWLVLQDIIYNSSRLQKHSAKLNNSNNNGTKTLTKIKFLAPLLIAVSAIAGILFVYGNSTGGTIRYGTNPALDSIKTYESFKPTTRIDQDESKEH